MRGGGCGRRGISRWKNASGARKGASKCPGISRSSGRSMGRALRAARARVFRGTARRERHHSVRRLSGQRACQPGVRGRRSRAVGRGRRCSCQPRRPSPKARTGCRFSRPSRRSSLPRPPSSSLLGEPPHEPLTRHASRLATTAVSPGGGASRSGCSRSATSASSSPPPSSRTSRATPGSALGRATMVRTVSQMIRRSRPTDPPPARRAAPGGIATAGSTGGTAGPNRRRLAGSPLVREHD